MSLSHKVDFNLKGKKRFDKSIQKAIEKMLTAMANDILKESLENLKKNDSWVTGKLAQSGRVEYTGGYVFEAEVIFGAPYAGAVEYGSAPHWVPLGPPLNFKAKKIGVGRYDIKLVGTPNPKTQPLDYYAVRKLKARTIAHCYWNKKYYGVHTIAGFGIWKAIGIGGTQPHPYFRPAIDLITSKQLEYSKKYWSEIE